MNISRKDAAISNTGPDDAFPGSFRVVLSAPTKDRDGDTLLPEDWKQPLPSHITFDTDHGMSVATTVGSGTPFLTTEDFTDDEGNVIPAGSMIVDGTYSSLPRAQEARTLVRERHIRTTSVAFMSEKVTKDGKTRTRRELLNGAFVAIPSCREAVVLSAKAGARNSTADLARLQAAHDAIVEAGAMCAGPADASGAEAGTTGGKSFRRMIAAKAVGGSYEERQRAIDDALSAAYPGDDQWAYSIATFDDNVVYRVSGGGVSAGQWQVSYTFDGATVTLGDPTRVSLVESVVPLKAVRSVETKAADSDHTPAQIAQAVDAALDEATALLASVDRESLPAEVRQALDLMAAAALSADELLEALGVDNPDDEDDEGTAADPAAPSGDAAKSAAADALALRLRALTLAATTAG